MHGPSIHSLSTRIPRAIQDTFLPLLPATVTTPSWLHLQRQPTLCLFPKHPPIPWRHCKTMAGTLMGLADRFPLSPSPRHLFKGSQRTF